MPFEMLIFPVTIVALVTSALSGVIEARRSNMDLVGALAVAFFTAVGGGTIRDMILGNFPVFWLTNDHYALIVFGSSLAFFYSSRLMKLTERSMLVPDAMGLGLFTILGVVVAHRMGTSFLTSVMMGVITGVFGGILRDMACNRIPVVFSKSPEFYATASFIGACVYLLLIKSSIDTSTASISAFLLIVIIRLISVRYRLHLPEAS